jgi:hypothetical protein
VCLAEQGLAIASDWCNAASPQERLSFAERIAELGMQFRRAHGVIVIGRIVDILHVARVPCQQVKAETVTVAAIEQGVPMLADARALIDRFHAMIRKKAEIEFVPWIDESKRSLIASFATGIANDKAAVHAAITLFWSNGQVEAQITKLKLVKRQMYGRAKLDLLQARLIGAP